MGVDTVKLTSPKIAAALADHVERQSFLRSGVELKTGEIKYEIITGQLDGSYDSRIRVVVRRKEWLICDKTGKPYEVECEPYLEIEGSVHKARHGQNIYGDTTNAYLQCHYFIHIIERLFNPDHDPALIFPDARDWIVNRIDWAEVYQLTPAAIGEFFYMINHAKYPRRSDKAAKYGRCAAYFPGTVTFKLYHKGPEFREHDYHRLKAAYKGLLIQSITSENAVEVSNQIEAKVARKLRALQRLADNRLRVEAEIHADKLRYDFGRLPYVSEITDEYLTRIYDDQIKKLLKEGDCEMQTVRTHEAVKARLQRLHGTRKANNLLAFWMRMAAEGEDRVQPDYSKAQFWRNKKDLIESGISWLAGDVYIRANDTALPADFSPIRSDFRRCSRPVRPHSTFDMCALDYAHLKAA